ncbi:MAG TPA: cyclase family protein [Solirubrobacteraceae bacterium]|nr:cyclase family protein [Solirubrobacteraceae bacterium]
MISRICAAAALLAAGAVIGWAGSAGGTQSDGAGAKAQVPNGKLVDLSYPFNARTIYWPTAKTFTLEKVAEGETEGGYFYAANNFEAAEHGGTHLDAPVHFARNGDKAHEIPLRRLIGQAVVVDVSRAALADPDYQVTREALRTHERRHGKIPRGAIVLLRTGFGRYWPDRERYLGTAELGEGAVPKLHFPGLHPGGARWLVRQRDIRAVGLDTASIDYGQSTGFESHRILGAANVPVFENVANLDRLPAEDFLFIGLPMKIEGGSGGPLRAIAIVPR